MTSHARATAPAPLPAEKGKLRHLRWYICGLLLLGTMINYLDRQATPVLRTMLTRDMGWDEAGFGWVMFAFTLAYAAGFPVAGRVLDRVGVRRGMAGAVALWSLAAMAHTLARGVWGFAIARFALGLSEAANFPASIKAVAEWFPKRQRALATAIFNNGTNVGAMLAFVLLAIAEAWQDWRAVFVITGLAGLAWLAAWLWLYRSPDEHPLLSAQERALIRSDQDPEAPALQVPWPSILRYRQAWAFLLGKMLTDPVWIFYLSWLPAYLEIDRKLSLVEVGRALIWIYLAADVGSIFGGWLSGFLIPRGLTAPRARLAAMASMAICMPASAYAAFERRYGIALLCFSLVTAAHQAWSANLFTLASDLFPRRMVGSIVGFGGMCGSLGNMFMSLMVGGWLQFSTAGGAAAPDYRPAFVAAGCMHVLAFALVLALIGRDPRPADVDAGLRTERSPALLAGGALAAATGAALAALIWTRWDAVVRATHSLAAAAGGLTASIGVLALGAALAYAGRGRPRPA